MDEKIILKSLEKIENDSMHEQSKAVDATVFYQKVKGLMALLETSIDSKSKGGGFNGW